MAREKHPVWYEGQELPRFSALAGDIECDVCIVGGGIAGISAAYFLAGKDLRVVLIEKDRLFSGATGATTAFLSSIIDTDMADLEGMFGLERARLIRESHAGAIDTVEDIARKESIECEFTRCATFLYARDASQRESLEAEQSAAKHLHYEVSPVSHPLGFVNKGALMIENEAKFHPLKYVGALANKAAERGVRIFEKSEACELHGDGPVTITTEHGNVKAGHVFLATYEPFTRPISLFFKKAFYVSYLVSGTVSHGVLEEATYEDLSNPYNYFRIDAGEKRDRIVIGGQDHRSDVKVTPTKNFKALEEFVRTTFPDVDIEIDRQWRGPILEPLDGLAYIGPFGSQAVYVAMGFSGNGMTYGTLSGKMFADHVLGNGSKYSSLYDPGRVPDLRDLYVKGRDYIGEFFGGAVKNSITYSEV